MLLGGLMLGLALAVPQALLTHLPGLSESVRTVLLLVGLTGLLGAELFGPGVAALAGNFTVPAAWVAENGRRAGVLWGLILGSGFITQAPFAVFHGAVIAAVLQPQLEIAILAGFTFSLGRALVTLLPWTRRTILNAMDKPLSGAAIHRAPTLAIGFAEMASRLLLSLSALVVLWVLVSGGA